MHIEVYRGGDTQFYYRTVNGNRTTTDTEGFTRKPDAKRAAQNHVRAVCKAVDAKPVFRFVENYRKRDGSFVTRITWEKADA